MKHADHIADTLSIAGIRLLAILHGLLFVAFLATLLLLAPKAGAGELPACSGQDLVAELQARDPGRLAAIRDKAEAGETVVTLPPGFAPEGKVVVARPEALELVSYLKSLDRSYPAVEAATN